MAPLAERLQVARPVVAGVVIEMRGSQVDRRDPDAAVVHDVGPGRRPPAAIAPRVVRRVKPPSVRQAADGLPMRPTAKPAAADAVRSTGLEADAGADLGPIERVEPAVRAEGHGRGGFGGLSAATSMPEADRSRLRSVGDTSN